ncbi:MAG: hypothetical protein KGN79_00155 [Acidobacteriota bacterium]|nr:hypothetical protein [Acidobacteriota bacterium]
MMAFADQFAEELQKALDRDVLKRLPLTFQPFVNEQLRRWEFLFPNERQSVERLLVYVDGLSEAQSSTLFHEVVDLEQKMGVEHWHFSRSEQTIQNASLLAGSQYFQQWRSAVQVVFDAADQHAMQTHAGRAVARNRLVVMNMPRRLPVHPNTWARWQRIGKPVALDLRGMPPGKTSLEILLPSIGSGVSVAANAGGAAGNQETAASASADMWMLDAGKSLVEAALPPAGKPVKGSDFILLSYERLDKFRDNFSSSMNTMRKDLTDADSVYDRLRNVSVEPWCPPEVENSAAVREYVRALFLSGNGAVIFCNSFVQWGASEAFRRARPYVLAAQFGVRDKPKPFTGVAVFDNPNEVNPTPAVEDLPGSAEDAEMLSLYVWLSALRYTEYQSHTACICIAESLEQAYLIAPEDFPALTAQKPVTLTQLSEILRKWVAPVPA